METKTIDAGEFRSGQKLQWNSAADGWRKWSELIDQSGTKISDRMIELAAIKPGSRVLDVACGYGEPALTAARAVGPSGSVVATDISAQMLAFGRERARAAGIGTIEFVESDAGSLNFPNGSFDAALSRWGIIFEPDAERAAARIRGFLKPGSRMALASWGTPEQVPFLAIPLKTVRQLLDVAPPPPGTPGPLSRPSAESLGGLLSEAGFQSIETEEAEASFEWRSPEEFTTFVTEIAPPVSVLLAEHPPEVQAKARNAISQAIGAHAGADGRVRLVNRVILASGQA